ncbi:conserved hypothetical protein [Frankia canadensis]|uniref:Condensation domain-containing protein n=1 Tax=Frankia canadensis TaxID=1836972 RepID=A0A2I2KUB1_9ACTN|nr:hypothetical protein [Frankia canadensis]SNQ49239.1 conserved hypothetical protein [Frankia canadensis]SOU56529.1 conserved hypothetical protein [Frankia canadensis]
MTTIPARPGRLVVPRDRVWRRTQIVGVLGPLDVPSPPRLRDALYRLAAIAPGRPPLCTLDRAGTRWRPVPGPRLAEHLDRVVRPLDPDVGGADDVLALVERGLRTPPADLPLRISVGGEHVLVEMSHLVGDGRHLDLYWSELLGRALDGGVPTLAAHAGPRLALPRAFAATFARHPGRLAAIARGAGAAAGDTPLTERGGGAGPDGGADPAFVARHTGPELLRAVRDARGGRDTGRSVAGILFAAAWSAVARAGLPAPAPGLWVLFDGRRFLPVPAGGVGNFVAGVYLEPADPRDPVAISTAMRAVIDSGRPVATMAAAAAKQLAPPIPLPRRGRGPAAPPSRPAPTLAVNFLPRLPGFTGLPWRASPGERTLALASTPGGPGGITVTMAELDGCLHVSITFDGALFERKAVRAMAELLCADPLGLVR